MINGINEDVVYMKEEIVYNKIIDITGLAGAIKEGTAEGWSSSVIKSRGDLCNRMSASEKVEQNVVEDCEIIIEYIDNMK